MNQKVPKILVTSVSKKVPLIRELRKALSDISDQSLIIGADFDEHCIASHFVDEFWKMPVLTSLAKDDFIEKCLELEITGIIPTRDGELNYLASIKHRLKEKGILLMLSEQATVEQCLDKLQFSEKLQQLHYPVIPSVENIDELNCEFFVVKERLGAGAKTILLNEDKESVFKYAAALNNPIFQPFVKGEEFSIDVYFTQDNLFKGAVVRKRELVVDGESQVTATVSDSEMEELCKEIGSALTLVGHNIFQIIKSQQGTLHIVEINTRFGGASTLSIAAGLNSFYWFALESIGNDISKISMLRSKSQLRQIRYPMDEIVELL